MKHFTIKVIGQVQGVGFRYAAYEKALELGLKGFARNEADGSVYIEAEGDKSMLNNYLLWLQEGPRFARVRKVTNTVSDVLKQFASFTIE